MVLMFSLLAFQLASPAGYSLVKGLQTKGSVSQKRVETLVDRSIHGSAIVTNPDPNPNPSPSLALTLTLALARTRTLARTQAQIQTQTQTQTQTRQRHRHHGAAPAHLQEAREHHRLC